MGSDPQPTKCFLDLPREIRDEVYHLCLLIRYTKRTLFYHSAIPHSLQLALLQTCGLIHEESSYILYCANKFVRIVTNLEIEATDIAARGVACLTSGENTSLCTRVHPLRIDYDLEATLRFGTFDASSWRGEEPKSQLRRYKTRGLHSAIFLIAAEDLATSCAILCFPKTEKGARIGCWSIDLRQPISCYRPEPAVPSPQEQLNLVRPSKQF